jgi:8-oxo-dGTP pyrophosphatase MutT (NUDIX family)
MLNETSAGLIVYRKENNKILFLLLHKEASGKYKECWAFPKGLIEKSESKESTALRETEEEAGISDLRLIPDFKERIHYMYKGDVGLVTKDVYYFLAETKQKEIKVSYEHSGGQWFEYKEALSTLTFNNDQQVLKKANLFLQEEQKQKSLADF